VRQTIIAVAAPKHHWLAERLAISVTAIDGHAQRIDAVSRAIGAKRGELRPDAADRNEAHERLLVFGGRFASEGGAVVSMPASVAACTVNIQEVNSLLGLVKAQILRFFVPFPGSRDSFFLCVKCSGQLPTSAIAVPNAGVSLQLCLGPEFVTPAGVRIGVS
jgi:hypothetical protein